jgi:hypothetical protein
MKNSKKRKLCFVILVMSLFTASACSLTGFTKGKGIAEAAVIQFHNQYNAGQFRQIYTQADETFKKYGSSADFISLLEALSRKLGTMKQSAQSGWHVEATTIGTIVTLDYHVEFSKGKGTERFIFRVSGDKALLRNYNVNSPLLLLK